MLVAASKLEVASMLVADRSEAGLKTKARQENDIMYPITNINKEYDPGI